MSIQLKRGNFKINDENVFCTAEVVGTDTWVTLNGTSYKLENFGVNRVKKSASSNMASGDICAPMPGQILKIFVGNGDTVETGDSLFVVEAMKMEHTLKAPCSGKITGLKFKETDTVTGSDIILSVVED